MSICDKDEYIRKLQVLEERDMSYNAIPSLQMDTIAALEALPDYDTWLDAADIAVVDAYKIKYA